VIAVDTNILVYAHRADSRWHGAARAAVENLSEGSAAWAIPWPCLYEFLAVTTHPRIYAPPTPLDDALDQVDAWLQAPRLVVLTEPDGHWPQLRSALAAAHVVGPRVNDARIAALCAAHGVREMWSADRDFTRFPWLKLRNPLVG
jgi:toxin-antitoxin system PIN domain toxin